MSVKALNLLKNLSSCFKEEIYLFMKEIFYPGITNFYEMLITKNQMDINELILSI